MTETLPRAPQYFRHQCGYVTGPFSQQPDGCPSCGLRGGEFTITHIVFPAQPSDAAIARDTRDVEATIRQVYAQLAEHPFGPVPLADLRDALPAGLDRETVDAALTKLVGHADVHIIPNSDQAHANLRTQQAALNLGNKYNHTLYLENRPSYLADTLVGIRFASLVEAESILAPLSDDDVAYLAERMDVTTSPAGLRQAVAERAEANRQQWIDNAVQSRIDGILLYRADTEPDWVATWTTADRRAAAEAAARLQHLAATEPAWAYVKARADRWAATPKS